MALDWSVVCVCALHGAVSRPRLSPDLSSLRAGPYLLLVDPEVVPVVSAPPTYTKQVSHEHGKDGEIVTHGKQEGHGRAADHMLLLRPIKVNVESTSTSWQPKQCTGRSICLDS